MAIQFDNTTFSIYFGTLAELGEKKAIPVNLCEKGIIGSIWEHNKRHYFDFYSNKK